MVGCVIQARMTSRRFPGKVLAPFGGEPVLLHVIRRAQSLRGTSEVAVLTSTDVADDPIAAYCERLRVPVWRGSGDDVLSRFRDYAAQRRCELLLRLSADSPLLDPELLQRLIDHPERGQADVVTTIFPRTFPRGRNGELIRAASLLELPLAELTDDDREHVTPFFYRHADRYRIVNVASDDAGLAQQSLAIDTLDDLRRLERMSR